MSTEITRKIAPSIISSLSALELEFEAKTIIQQQSAKAAHMMANVNNATDSLQFARAILDDFESLKDHRHTIWTTEMDLMLISTRIRVYGFQLYAQSQEQRVVLNKSKSYELDISNKVLQQSGLADAVRLIHIFSELVDIWHTEPASPSRLKDRDAKMRVRGLPKFFFTGLLFAVSFIFKCMAQSGSDLPHSVSDLARNHIQLAHRILSSLSMDAEDELARATKMIEVLSRARDLSPLKVSERSRAHLLDDTIRAAQEIRSSVAQTVEFEKGSKFAETPVVSGEGTAYVAATQNFEEPNAPDMLPADFNFDMGQNFDWNSLLGFDYLSGHGDQL